MSKLYLLVNVYYQAIVSCIMQISKHSNLSHHIWSDIAYQKSITYMKCATLL